MATKRKPTPVKSKEPRKRTVWPVELNALAHRIRASVDERDSPEPRKDTMVAARVIDALSEATSYRTRKGGQLMARRRTGSIEVRDGRLYAKVSVTLTDGRTRRRRVRLPDG